MKFKLSSEDRKRSSNNLGDMSAKLNEKEPKKIHSRSSSSKDILMLNNLKLSSQSVASSVDQNSSDINTFQFK